MTHKNGAMEQGNREDFEKDFIEAFNDPDMLLRRNGPNGDGEYVMATTKCCYQMWVAGRASKDSRPDRIAAGVGAKVPEGWQAADAKEVAKAIGIDKPGFLLITPDGEPASVFEDHGSPAEKLLYQLLKNTGSFQDRVAPWMLECFGEEISGDIKERLDRFLEESLELAQSLGYQQEDAVELADYVFNRPIGDPPQEVGGVRVTLAALCQAAGLNEDECGETELRRIWTKIPEIREKQKNKPAIGPRPGVYPERSERAGQ